MLEEHPPRVIYHQVYSYKKKNSIFIPSDITKLYQRMNIILRGFWSLLPPDNPIKTLRFSGLGFASPPRRNRSEGLSGSMLFRVSDVDFGCSVWNLGFRVWGWGFGVLCLVFDVLEFGVRVSDIGLRVSGFGFRVSGFGFWVSGFGVQVSGFRFRVLGFGFRVSGVHPCFR